MDGFFWENPSHKNQWMIIPIDPTCSIQSDTGELRSNAIVVKSLVTFLFSSSQKKKPENLHRTYEKWENLQKMPMISGEEKFPKTPIHSLVLSSSRALCDVSGFVVCAWVNMILHLIIAYTCPTHFTPVVFRRAKPLTHPKQSLHFFSSTRGLSSVPCFKWLHEDS